MNKKVIIGIIVLAVIALAVVLLIPGPSQAPTNQPAEGTEKPVSQTSPTPVVKPTPTGSGSVLVEIKNLAFIGKETVINAGTKIIWQNNDPFAHTVTSDTGLFNSGRISKGQTFSYTFKTPGEYKYHCSIHPEMTASIVVK